MSFSSKSEYEELKLMIVLVMGIIQGSDADKVIIMRCKYSNVEESNAKIVNLNLDMLYLGSTINIFNRYLL